MTKVSLIILNYNNWQDTEECLGSIRKMETGTWNLEIVVVDNESKRNDSGSLQCKQARMTKLKIKTIQNEKNLGFAGGNNVGIKYALENGADYIMILNNDTLVDKNLMKELLKTMEQDESIGVAGPKIYFAPGYEFHKNRYSKNQKGKVIWYSGGMMDWQNVLASHRKVDEVDKIEEVGREYEETDFVSGCAMMVRKEVFEKIGLFDEKYFLYWEDNDLCQRAKRAGFKVVYVSRAIVSHKNAGSAGGSGSDLQDYYTTRNRLLFGMKYAPWKVKLALIKESFSLLMSGRNYQKQGVKDFYLKKLGKGTFTNI